MRDSIRRGMIRLAAAAGGMLFLFEGCDPTTRASIENGIITASSSLLGAFLRAAIDLGTEAAST